MLDETKLNAVPGIRAVEALLTHDPARIKSLLLAGERSGARGRLAATAERLGISIRTVKMNALTERLDGLQHQGVVALVEPADYVSWESLLSHPSPLILAVDQVTDPRNLGAMLRAGEAMGVTGALVTRSRCARLGPTVAKTSAGASELLPVAMESNLARALERAQAAGCQVIGAAFDGVAPAQLDFTGPTVLVVGSEGKGLRRLTREVCDQIVTIPLIGRTESLNAATAAAVLFYAASVQRPEKNVVGP